MFRNADLHCHSLQSDGVLTPEALAERAFERQVDLWALTDHDELSGVARARKAAASLGIAFLGGVEISVTWASRTIHVVGLGVDENNQTLQNGLAQMRQSREQRSHIMAQKLEQVGIPDAYAGALSYVRNPDLVSRTHFARYIVERGYGSSMQAVFDQYLSETGVAFVPTQWANLEEALTWIDAAGGVAVIAHPGRYKYTELEFDALFTEFKSLGGKAIEVNTGSHRPDQNAYYAKLANDYGFLASIGSDFHGPSESRVDLGTVTPLPKHVIPVWHVLDV